MSIPPDIQALVNQLSEELALIQGKARKGINIVRPLLSRFPNNASLVGLSIKLNNALFFVDNFKRRIRTAINQVSSTDVSVDAIQEVGEDLSEFLGRAIETKIQVDKAIAILEELE